MEEQQDNTKRQDIPSADPLSSMEREPGWTPNVGFSNPGSPGDLTGASPLPESGGVGAADPAGGVDIEGDEPVNDQGIVDQTRATGAEDRSP